jgi:hypothetical protein
MSDLSLLPLPLRIKVVRAVTRVIRLDFALADGTVVDITGATVTLTVKATPSAAAAVVYTVNATLTNPAQGVATLTIPDSATFGTDGTVTRYYHEIRLIESNGNKTPWWAGSFEVWPTPAPL